MHIYTKKQHNRRSSYAVRFKLHRLIFLAALFALIPAQQATADTARANAVLAACAPNPTVPDVNSCSACHSTTNNRGPNDLTPAGEWALSPATYMNFCPNTTPPTPTPTPTPTPDPTPPPPTSGMGMSSQPPSTGMGMGRGGDDDDDDDDEYEEDDDDDGGSSAASFRSRSLGSRRSSRRGGD